MRPVRKDRFFGHVTHNDAQRDEEKREEGKGREEKERERNKRTNQPTNRQPPSPSKMLVFKNNISKEDRFTSTLRSTFASTAEQIKNQQSEEKQGWFLCVRWSLFAAALRILCATERHTLVQVVAGLHRAASILPFSLLLLMLFFAPCFCTNAAAAATTGAGAPPDAAKHALAAKGFHLFMGAEKPGFLTTNIGKPSLSFSE